MAKKKAAEKKENDSTVKISKLRTNYKLTYDFNQRLNQFIKTIPKEHWSVKVENTIINGKEKDVWSRIVSEAQMGKVMSFLIDNAMKFSFDNVCEDDLNKLRFEYKQRQDRIAEVLRLKADSLDITNDDFSFLKKQPYDYQKQAVKFFEINEGKALLGDQPGVGKSLSIMAYAAKHKIKTLIVCPASLKLNWRNEIRNFTNEQSYVFKYKPKKSSKELNYPKEDSLFHIINYESLDTYLKFEFRHKCRNKKCKWECEDLAKSYTICPGCNSRATINSKVNGVIGFGDKDGVSLDPNNYGLIALDEAHYIKNSTAGRTKLVKKAFLDVPKKILVSGTAMKNRPMELFSLLNFLEPKEWNNAHAYGLRYCLHEEAPILMDDLSEKHIKDIKIGDKILSWQRIQREKLSVRRLCEAEVKNVLIRKGDLYKITLDNGKEIISTLDHKWLNGYSKGGNDNLEFSTPKIGNEIVYIHSEIKKPEYFETDNFKKGYLVGFFRGDGHCSKLEIKKTHPFREQIFEYVQEHKVGCANQDVESIERIEKYLTYFNIPFSKKFTETDSCYRINCSNKIAYDFINQLKEDKDKPWWSGFLSGIYDAEGSGQVIAQCLDHNPTTYGLIKKCLDILDFKYVLGKESIRLTGGRNTMVKLWETSYPALTRKLKSYILNGGGRFMTNKNKIKNIELYKKNTDVYTLTTSTGFYIAYGMGSKNCAGFESPWGWDFDGASNLEELFTRISPFFLRRLKKDVLKSLPPKTFTNIPLELSDKEYREYKKIEKGVVDDITKEGEGDEPEKLNNHLTNIHKLKMFTSQIKLKNAIDIIQDIIDADEKVVAFSQYVNIAQAIAEHFEDKAVVFTGKNNITEKQDAVDAFQKNPKIKVFSGTIGAAGVGITLTAASKLIFIDKAWDPSSNEQAADRIHRASSTASNIQIISMTCEDTIDEDIENLLTEKEKIITKALDNTVLTKNVNNVELSIFKQLVAKLREK